MAKPTELNAEIFESLLTFFSSDRDEAGLRYEKLREGLIRYFCFRGCSDGESLADETIARVAKKLDHYDPVRAPRFTSYVYGFASRVLLEAKRTEGRVSQLDEDPRISETVPIQSDEDSNRIECLQKCLDKGSRSDIELIVAYYDAEGADKKAVRQRIADKLGLSAGALHTKIFRIKVELRKCVENCLSERKI